MSKANAWRRQAQEYRDVARWLSLHDERRQLLEAAAQLEGRADAEERAAEAEAGAARRKPEPG